MNDEMFDKPKCCISIDASCANVVTYYDQNSMEEQEYCANQMDCEDFDPIWTEEDADNAIEEFRKSEHNKRKL